MTHEQTKQSVSEYYANLKSSSELLTNACCTGDAPPQFILDAIGKVHPAVQDSYYGCGLVFPEDLEGLRVLDLGCGTGRDCYIMAQLVGPKGFVLGVDMTDEQLSVANEHVEYHREKFGYESANTEFRKGYIERLADLNLADGSFDLIVSNCVVNLSPDKNAVFSEAFRLLKPGGEMYFSDVYSDRRVPKYLRENSILWGECLSGALYWNDFLSLSRSCGFLDPRLVKDSVITVENKKLEALIGHIRFFSATYRLFKLDSSLLEGDCEDYGQAVVYKGTIPRNAETWSLDGHHQILKGKVFPVCGNTYNMLKHSRFEKHFDFIGNFDSHFGIFDGCGKIIPFASAAPGAGGDNPCC